MKTMIKILLGLVLFLVLIIVLLNLIVVLSMNKRIVTISELEDKEFDCILVLGAGIRQNRPSPMLEDRLLMAVKLYEEGVAPKILVSGDHQYDNYDEVNVMKNYLKEKGIPTEDIFMDHAGISSYDSIYRAKEIFTANRIVIVTQKYHLYRSLYIGRALDISVYGVPADRQVYYGNSKREIREVAARVKDFIKCLILPEPTYMGEVISIKGNGDRTNDNENTN